MKAQEMKECCGSFKPQQPHSSAWDQPRGLGISISYARARPPSALTSWKFRLGSAWLHLLCLSFFGSHTHVCKFLSALTKLREA